MYNTRRQPCMDLHTHTTFSPNVLCQLLVCQCPGRRLECYRCCVAKPAHAATVSFQPDAPSHILKVSGLEQHIRYLSAHDNPIPHQN